MNCVIILVVVLVFGWTGLYGDATIHTADQKRMRHLEQKMANDGHLAELSCQARTNMRETSRG